MKRLINSILLSMTALGCIAVLSPATSAQGLFDEVCSGVSGSSVCTEKDKPQSAQNNLIYGEGSILARATQVVVIAVGVASVIMIIVGGLKYVLSAGDASKASSAKNTIIYALVGLLVAAFAQGIIVFVLNRF